MSRHDVKVLQLCSDNPVRQSFLNVDEKMGHIGVWGDYVWHPTYICFRSNTFEIIQFDGEEWAEEWIEENKQHWDVIKKLNP